jgi:hypothetical protein
LNDIGDKISRVLSARPKLVFTLLLLTVLCASSLLANSTPQAHALPACAQIPPNLVAWWPGDGNPNDIVNGYNGVLQGGATYDTGEVAQAFSFDGSTGYVQGPNIGNFGANDFTIDLWANFNTVTGTDPFIAHDEGPGTVNKWIFWYTSGALAFHFNSPTLGSGVNIAYAWTPSTGTWYHLAVTRSGSTFALYIDGVQVSTSTISTPIPDAAAPLTIGRAESFYFNGRIDEVEIFYPRALTSMEVFKIATGKCKPVSMTVSYSIVGGGSPTAPSFNYVQFGVSKTTALLLAPTTTIIQVDANSEWSVAPNPLTGGGTSASKRWYSTDPLNGYAYAGTWVFTFHKQFYLTVQSAYDTPGGEGWYDSGSTAYATLASGTAPAGTGVRHAFDVWGYDSSGSDYHSSNPITMDVAKTAIATWKTQYRVVFNQNGVSGGDFTGTIVIIDGTGYSSLPHTFWWDDTSVHTFAFQSPLTTAIVKHTWSSTSGLSTLQSDSITVSGSGSVVGNYGTKFKHTITSSPDTGLAFVKVDGGVAQASPYTTPWWNSGDSHTIEALSPLNPGGGTKYVWVSWSDGGANPNTVSPTSPTTFTANYQTQNRVNAKTNHDVVLNVNVVVDRNYASPMSTPFFVSSGTHTFAAPWTILVGGGTYNFLGWRDATGAVLSRGATFTYNLQSVLTAVYGLPTYTLTVFVYDSTTRAPLMDAKVRLDGVLVGSTDSLGRLVISVEAGYHNVKIAKPTAYSAYTTTVNINSNIVLRVFLNRVV